MAQPDTVADRPGLSRSGRLLLWAELAGILLVFFLHAGGPPPDVNEAHYLGKAKHYWNPEWCAGDLFLESRDAHLVFNWLFGWTTLLLPLPAVAWLGRLVAWTLLAAAWQRLCRAVFAAAGFAVPAAAVYLAILNRFHLAGEWVVGGVEAKAFAFPLVFWALAELVRGSWSRAVVAMGAATGLHALVGGWSMVALGLAWLMSRGRPPLRRLVAPGLVAAVLATPGIAAGLALSLDVPPHVRREANRIYVYERLPHHLAPHRLPPTVIVWPPGSAAGYVTPNLLVVRHGMLLVGWCLLVWSMWDEPRQARLQRLVAGTVCVAAVGAAISAVDWLFPESGTGLLRYYWFRASDAMVPLGVTLACGQHLQRLAGRRRRAAVVAATLVVAAATADLALRVADRVLLPIPAADRDSLVLAAPSRAEALRVYRQWRRVCQWVRTSTAPEDRFLTPHQQKTFKWYAERAEVVTWKDVPQDPRSLIEWWQRYQQVYPPLVRTWGLAAHSDARLVELARRYQARYILVDMRRYARPIALPRVYPGPRDKPTPFAVYWVPPAEKSAAEDRDEPSGDD